MRRNLDKMVSRAARLISRAPIRSLRGVGTGYEKTRECHAISRAYAAGTGGRVVHGFAVGSVQNIGRANVITFTHHSVVRSDAEELIDPNFLPGQTQMFLEDPARSYDYELDLSWNIIAVADRPFRCPATGARLPAWQPVWTTSVSGVSAFSTDPRHARRRHLGDTEAAQSYVASLGLDASNAVDLVFATNAEVVSVAIPDGEEPPESLKDYRRTDLTVPVTIKPRDPSTVLSEAEQAELRR